MRISELERWPLTLDGGLATELEARGHDLSDVLWSARLLSDAPGEIAAAHRTFVKSGAQVVSSASYQASFEGFAARGVGRTEASALLRRSVELVKEAAPGEEYWTAASVGPYGAMLADGSEYCGRYGVTRKELARFHGPRMEVLADAEPDLFAMETVPDVTEATVLVELAASLGLPAWLSYTIDGDTTRAGQPLDEAFEVVAGVDCIVAVGVNCCAPGDVGRAVDTARRVTGKPVVVYPNSGEQWNSGWAGRSVFAPQQVQQWIAAGARFIGGCCRVTPDEIRAVAANVNASAG